MSGSSNAFVFTAQQLTDIRRYCGYGAYGAGNSGFYADRFFTWYGTLEYRLQNLSLTDGATVTATYLANLYTLEANLYGSTANADTSSAAAWHRNPDELTERMRLYRFARLELCRFIGIPAGPDIGGGGSTARLLA